jgi:hypothetical protein
MSHDAFTVMVEVTELDRLWVLGAWIEWLLSWIPQSKFEIRGFILLAPGSSWIQISHPQDFPGIHLVSDVFNEEPLLNFHQIRAWSVSLWAFIVSHMALAAGSSRIQDFPAIRLVSTVFNMELLLTFLRIRTWSAKHRHLSGAKSRFFSEWFQIEIFRSKSPLFSDFFKYNSFSLCWIKDDGPHLWFSKVTFNIYMAFNMYSRFVCRL